MKILFVISDVNFFLSHRLQIAIASKEAGHDVSIAVPHASDIRSLEDHAFKVRKFAFSRKSKSPFGELKSLFSLFCLMKHERPDVAHMITAKPILYGGISSALLKIPTLFAVTGLGYIFTHNTFKTYILRSVIAPFLRFAINKSRNHTLFQNHEDQEIFSRSGFITKTTTSLIPGSGVDLNEITPLPLPEGSPNILLPARMLRDKGVQEFADAAKQLKLEGQKGEFHLLGDPDIGNPTSLKLSELHEFNAQGYVSWSPYTSDIGQALAACHIVVLPSYREGFPKSLIDAAAAGRAMVASDVPGCREAVVEGETGYLCKARDSGSLARVLKNMMSNPKKIAQMGSAARRHAEKHYDINTVCKAHLKIYVELSKRSAK